MIFLHTRWGGRRRRSPEITVRVSVTNAVPAAQRGAGGQRPRGQQPGPGGQSVSAGAHVFLRLLRFVVLCLKNSQSANTSIELHSHWLDNNNNSLICIKTAFERNGAEERTQTGVSQNCIQAAVVIVESPGLVVAVGPFTLHQKRPRHFLLFPASSWILLVRSENLRHTSPPLHAALSLCLTLSLGTLLLDRVEDTALGFLAAHYACAQRSRRLPGVAGAGGQRLDDPPLRVRGRGGGPRKCGIENPQ